MIKTFSYILFAIITICLLNACASKNIGLGSEIDAGVLANDYARDVKAGNKKYKGKYLTVTGKIAQTYKNKYQQSIIILMDKRQVNGVKCFLNNASRQINKPLKQDAIISINGRCVGFDEFVLLKGCIILKN